MTLNYIRTISLLLLSFLIVYPKDAAMARWTIDMQPFNCTVKYFAGKKNIVADCLSRLRNEPNLLDTVNKLPKITHIDDEVECHVTTRFTK